MVNEYIFISFRGFAVSHADSDCVQNHRTHPSIRVAKRPYIKRNGEAVALEIIVQSLDEFFNAIWNEATIRSELFNSLRWTSRGELNSVGCQWGWTVRMPQKNPVVIKSTITDYSRSEGRWNWNAFNWNPTRNISYRSMHDRSNFRGDLLWIHKANFRPERGSCREVPESDVGNHCSNSKWKNVSIATSIMKWKKLPTEFLPEKTFLVIKDDLDMLESKYTTNDLLNYTHRVFSQHWYRRFSFISKYPSSIQYSKPCPKYCSL